MSQVAIICVDDDVSILDSLEIELNKIVGNEYLIEMADNGEECLELCQELLAKGDKIALVISDCIMPGMRGDELLKQVHTLSPKTLTIMLTGQAEFEALGNAIRYAKLYRYISKPWEFEDLNLTVTEALRSYHQEQQLVVFYAHLEEKIVQRTQELQQKNAALLKLDRERKEFLGIAAHDLKNPLSAIQGLAELIIGDYDELTKHEVTEMMNMILISSKQMFELVNNLLEVNLIESEKMKISLQELDILPILQTLVNRYVVQARAKNITVNFIHQEESYSAWVDSYVIQRVFDNLISNAVKYSPFDKNIYIRLTQTANTVRCEIQDEGPGLSEADQKKLFGKFSRLTPAPTGQENSTGLGLFIVKKLVEAMEGKVWCESQLGKGSTFMVEFSK
jgi:signal transduction histidine kinase